MRVLLLGGTSSVRGGVELFCERSANALSSFEAHLVEHVRTDGPFLQLRTLHRYLRCFAEVARLRRRGWDVVWLQYVSFPEIAILLWCRLLGFPVVVTPHLGANWRSLRHPLLRFLTRYGLRAATLLALLAETQATELPLPGMVPVRFIRTFLPERLAVSPARERSDRAAPLRLIHVARLSATKGTFRFLDVCRQLRDDGVPLEATLIGQASSETLTDVTAFIAAHALEGIVRYGGVMREAEVLAALRRADVLIHLSSVDSYPLIVLEAIGSGVYPVCQDLPGARLICETYCGALVSPATSSSEIAGLLRSGRDAMAGQAQRAAAAAARDHGWGLCAELTSAAFRSALAATRRGAPPTAQAHPPRA